MIEPIPFNVAILQWEALPLNSSNATAPSHLNISMFHDGNGTLPEEFADFVALARSGLIQGFVATSSSILFAAVRISPCHVVDKIIGTH